MKLLDWLKPKPKSTRDLQAELRALCEKMVLQEGGYPSDFDRYEEILGELYKRGVDPETQLKPIKQQL